MAHILAYFNKYSESKIAQAEYKFVESPNKKLKRPTFSNFQNKSPT